MKKIYFASAWMFLSVGVILISIATLHFSILKKSEVIETTAIEETTTSNQEPDNLLVQKTGQVKGIQTIIEADDARVELVSNFLERYKSPLKPYDYFGQVFVDLADKYQIDFRLLPAIAMQESNLCKVIPEGSYNCLGFGVHSKGTLGFESFEANFDRAARELKTNYIDIGLTTPEKIMTKYTPHSNGSWADSVNQWMAEMKYDDRQKGKTDTNDADLLEFVETNTEQSTVSAKDSF